MINEIIVWVLGVATGGMIFYSIGYVKGHKQAYKEAHKVIDNYIKNIKEFK